MQYKINLIKKLIQLVLLSLLPATGIGSEYLIPEILEFERGIFNSSSEEEESHNFLLEVESVLPLKIKKSFRNYISIGFLSSSYDSEILLPSCSKLENPVKKKENHGVSEREIIIAYGKAFPGKLKIELHPGFHQVISRPSQESSNYSCMVHGNAYKLAKATLIHEIGHLYDYLAIKTEDEKRIVEEFYEKAFDIRDRFDARIKSHEYDTTISSRREFKLLAGWVNQGFIYKTETQRNVLRTHSPDTYEYTDIEENFATNLEFYLLDHEFRCRRPLYYDYFVRHFGEEPFANYDCRATKKVIVEKNGSFGNIDEITLDPNRVYQIDFLFADKGETTMSRWGHAMFRLVMCKENQNPEPACFLNQSEHLVVSFRANVDDLVINNWKGLFGGYPSQQFILPFLSVIDEYTLLENRNLLAIPLKLSRSEKKRFIDNIMTNAWTYRGEYKFLSNNCASEALWFLKTVIPDNEELQRLNIYTPLGLYTELTKIGLIDASVLDNDRIATGFQSYKSTHLFKSKRAFILKVFKEISNHMPYFDIDKYAIESNAEERFAYFVMMIQRNLISNSVLKKRFAAKFYLIEQYVKRKHSVDLLSEIIKIYESINDIKEKKRLFLIPIADEQPQNRFRLFMHGGYGIPLEDEYERAQSFVFTKSKEANDRVKSLLNDPIFSQLKPKIKELNEIENNLKKFRTYSTTEFMAR